MKIIIDTKDGISSSELDSLFAYLRRNCIPYSAQPILEQANVMQAQSAEPLPPAAEDDNDSIVNAYVNAFGFWYKLEPQFGDGPTVEDLLRELIDNMQQGGNGA